MSPTPSKAKKAFQLVSNHDDRLGLPTDDQSVYASFDIWMDEQLQQLVARWAHLAAPNASRPPRKVASDQVRRSF
jgi:hypothetical protein